MMAIGLLLSSAGSVFFLMSPHSAVTNIFHAAILGCGEQPTSDEGKSMLKEDDSIGVATMEKDGTIVLQLRAEGPGGILGDGLLRYPPDHPDYAKILDYIGGLTKGQAKKVLPWPKE
jgi:hypothetical protein